MTNRIVICGTRDFNDAQLLYSTIDALIKNAESSEIVTGGCRGADKIGECYAQNNNIPLKVFPADWGKYGRAAGPIRNKQMLDYALKEKATVIAFWDGKSRGTLNMINIAKKSKADVYVIKYGDIE